MVVVLVIDMIDCTNNGTSISARRFAEALSARGHEVRAVTLGDPADSGRVDPDGVRLFFVPELHIPFVSAQAHKQKDVWAKPVRETLLEAFRGADAVHVYNPWPLGKAAVLLAKELGIPVLGAFHCQPENITYNIGLGWLPLAAHLTYHILHATFYRHFTDIHCPSPFIAVQLRRHGYRQRLHVVSNGVHADFAPAEAPAARAPGPVRILMVGRLSPEKRQDVLIRAARLSRHAADLQLVFAGRGPWAEKLARMGRALPRPPVFTFLPRPELIGLMRGSDLYVHASDVEIEGLGCLEAISCGLVPVISDSRTSASGQFALRPENLFRAGDAADLARRIDAWLDDPARLAAARDEYRRFVPQYALDRSIRAIESVYARIRVRQSVKEEKNPYLPGTLFRALSYVFYQGVAVPVLTLYTRLFLGARVHGLKHLRAIRRTGALTLCNHVHPMDGSLVATALFPRKMIFPANPRNVETLWPGAMVRALGGVPLSPRPASLKVFLDEMELQLRDRRVVHLFPEGDLARYYDGVREFKGGAFRLAARARVPVVPMAIAFEPPSRLRGIIQKRPVMRLRIGEPIPPADADPERDEEIRRREAFERMRALVSEP